jgi:hypothetical protein
MDINYWLTPEYKKNLDVTVKSTASSLKWWIKDLQHVFWSCIKQKSVGYVLCTNLQEKYFLFFFHLLQQNLQKHVKHLGMATWDRKRTQETSSQCRWCTNNAGACQAKKTQINDSLRNSETHLQRILDAPHAFILNKAKENSSLLHISKWIRKANSKNKI